MSARIVVVGSANVDMVVKAQHIPRPGETVLGGEFTLTAGGKGANQAVAAARMGGHVTFVGRVGGDGFGADALKQLSQEGIDTTYLNSDPDSAHGIALILVDCMGENAIAVAPGANARLTAEDVERAEPAFAACDIVLLQLEVPLPAVEKAIELGKKHGKRVVLNPAPSAPLADRILAQIDVLTPNETEAEMLLGGGDKGLGGVASTAEELLRRGVGLVVVTMGREGVFVVHPESQYHIPGRKVQAVDTTAAGDAFSGALAVGLAEGRELKEALRRAVAASALSVTKMGAQASLPSLAEVEAFLAG